MKDISTLVSDIEALFGEESHVCDEKNLEELGKAISNVVGRRLAEVRSRKGTLRMSNLDKPDRQLFYELHSETANTLPPSTKIKFLFGDILEELLLFLATEAGHSVTHRQSRVEVAGISGSIDCIIDDDTLVDVKSASSQSFKSFSEKLKPGMFSYAYQLSGYTTGLGLNKATLLVIDKTLGHIALHQTTLNQLPNVKARIEHVKRVVSQENPPERCYPDEEDGKSGNRKLGPGCSYCNHKDTCWDNLRTFIYSNGPRYLTKVSRVPDVFEVTK